MAATIRDIAKVAGVSVATVSKVLNGYTTVSKATRENVMRIVTDMQFRPNTAARSLVGRRSMTLGVFLTTGLAHPFFVSLLGGIDEALKAKGYDLIYLSQLSAHPDYNFVQHCLSRNVEGVLVFGFQRDQMNFEELLNAGIPTIFIDLDRTGSRAGYISSDNAKAIVQAVGYLKELNHRRIAFITGIPGSYTGERRFAGFLQGLSDYGLPHRPEYIAEGDFSRESGYAAMQRLLALPERPSAVVCCSDMSAFGAMDAIRDAGLSVPGDISVIGFDDIEAAGNVRPALTTVRQDMYAIGRTAIELLDKLIVDPVQPSPEVIIPTELVVRETCRPMQPEAGE
ncbi:LacI family DNA-binding transcriptional regulator [Cohnella nanjingensis]|uniref:LacI family DNA-binding transcriptional regulator n=1 Tax=Cohnella nanjingensis TaxID=1387779 RepID=A0A7X0RN28_9BACL|nr:LacI family DNA-binding transcriptional regulator [Cohnella nanjingensis]MBB6670303.1 LacI family DNA-binding transcriptional regulator [Cohnella nanjingensis]